MGWRAPLSPSICPPAAPPVAGEIPSTSATLARSMVFEVDVPKPPELVSIDGSFTAGRDLDDAAIIFRASAQTGAAYL